MSRIGIMLALAAVVLAGCASQTARNPIPVTTISPAPAVDPLKYMPGDGVYQKYWGLWQSDPAPTDCFWSILAADPYTPTVILDHGVAAPGESVRVNIQPVSGHNVVFQTHGCGSWHYID